MITTVSTAFERELVKYILERKAEIVSNVAGGLAIKTIEEYREAVGKIAALDEVISMCEEVSATINKTM
jgi:hypothetical protein